VGPDARLEGRRRDPERRSRKHATSWRLRPMGRHRALPRRPHPRRPGSLRLPWVGTRPASRAVGEMRPMRRARAPRGHPARRGV